MRLLAIILLLRGYHMKLLLMTLYIIMIMCFYRVIAQSGRVTTLKDYRSYDTRRRTQNIKSAERSLALRILELVLTAIAILLTLSCWG
jgi:hypothetical protein